ncbi:MAG: CPBP family intramembrane glutamic endopeptidase [Candidatus Limnocylindria bacterium]
MIEPEDGSAPAPAPPPRPGASTFTIEGRAAPALFVVGWLATIVGLGATIVAVLGGTNPAAPILLVAGLLVLAIGLVASAGSQAIERRARGVAGYTGPSPFLVFGASVPVSLLAAVLIGVPLSLVGVAVDGPVARLASVAVQALVYAALIRLLVVDTGALGWLEMGIRRFDRRAAAEMASGAMWAAPVIVATIIVAGLLSQVVPVTPVSPLPPTGDLPGLLLNLLAGAVIAPLGEELLFRGFATTAWARTMGERRALVQAALFFAFVHVLTISGSTAGEAAGLALVGFVSRIPVALALGWLFLRRGSIWAPIGLHATFNGILIVVAELALREGLV